MSRGKRVDILVTGAGGQLGMAINNLLAQQTGPSYVALPKSELNIGNEADMSRVMEEYRPRFVVNCAADTKVNRADLTPTTSWDVNGRAVSGLARWCARIGASLIHLSTDFVFGRNMGNTQAYEEDDVVGPVNNYGTSKLVGEYEIMRTDSETVGGLSYYIIRTAGLFCMPRPLPTRNFPIAIAGKLANETQRLQVVDDVHTNITRAEDLAKAVLYFIWQP
jgi:dTDP-4-dehydrorhamnose reductase